MGKGIVYSICGKNCPCKGCGERKIGCHGKYDKYKEWDGKRQAEKLERYRRTSLKYEAEKRKKIAVDNYRRRGRQA